MIIKHLLNTGDNGVDVFGKNSKKFQVHVQYASVCGKNWSV